jgi:REP element-mobilizing transposase RayT
MPDMYNFNQKPFRLENWDYTTPGAYFVTIFTHEKEHLFTNIKYRAAIETIWQAIPSRFHAQHVNLDEWVLMPNHLHGILILTNRADGSDTPSGEKPTKGGRGLQPGSVGAIVGNFKLLATKRIKQLSNGLIDTLWQNSFYDHVIRDEKHLLSVRKYIRNSPQRWAEKNDNLARLMSQLR